MMMKHMTYLGVPLLAAGLLAGCQLDDNPAMASYQVTLTNLTEAQPLSPPALVLHCEGYQPWQIGNSASPGLEQLAEGGATDAFIAEAKTSHAVRATVAESAPILPGASNSTLIAGLSCPSMALSLATMLVNTNDSFTGLAAVPINTLAVLESITFSVAAFDAGTEANSETAATVPGPAGGGEGYNTERDDSDRVGGHPGVVSADDGLDSSVLGVSHRFDNPVARISVTRLE